MLTLFYNACLLFSHFSMLHYFLFIAIAMGEEHQQQPSPINININASEPQVENSRVDAEIGISNRSRYKWWLQVAVYAFFVLSGQSGATLLGRLYFNNGGKSKWIASLVQVVGFPVLLPFQWLSAARNRSDAATNQSSPAILASFYVSIGILLAAGCVTFSIGLQFLPVTTFSLICASQLGFIALFSYFLNRQKFTPYTLNSVILLTISSILLVFQPDSGDSNKPSRRNYTIGFACTVAASAGAALLLSVTQLAFQRIIKRVSLRAVVDVAVYESLVASAVLGSGFVGSGDWRRVRGEMEGYGLGKVGYVMVLFWACVCWQVFTVGVVGLVFEVSSLFTNVVMSLGLPVAPVLAVVFLHDRLSGVKAVALVVAMWGSASYIYQHYLEDLKMKEKCDVEEVSEVALVVNGRA